MDVQPERAQHSACSAGSLEARSPDPPPEPRGPPVAFGLQLARTPGGEPQPRSRLRPTGHGSTGPALGRKEPCFRRGMGQTCPHFREWGRPGPPRHGRRPCLDVTSARPGKRQWWAQTAAVGLAGKVWAWYPPREPWRVTFICVTTWVIRANLAMSSWSLSSDPTVRAASGPLGARTGPGVGRVGRPGFRNVRGARRGRY